MDPTPFINIVSSEQSRQAAEEDPVEDTLPDYPDAYTPWPRPSEYAVLGIGVAVVGGLLGLMAMMVKARAPVTQQVDPLAPQLPLANWR